MKRRSIRAALIVAAGLVLTGCTATDSTAEQPTSLPTSTESSSAVTIVSTEETCSSLSEPSSLSFNAFNEFRKGNIDVATRNQMILDSLEAYKSVPVEPGSKVENALNALLTYIDTSPPDSHGAAFDPSQDAFANAGGSLSDVCAAAGTEIIVKVTSGG